MPPRGRRALLALTLAAVLAVAPLAPPLAAAAATVSGPLSPVTPANGRGAAIALHASRDGFLGGDAQLDGGGLLPVRVGKAGERPQLPPVGALMGTVFRDTLRAHVFRAAGAPRRDPDDGELWLVPVRATGLAQTGDYRGRIALDPASAADAPVALDVTVSDTWVVPVLVVVLGALAAFVGQLWIRNWRVGFRWERRIHRLAKAYVAAGAAFGRATDRCKVEGPGPARVTAYTDKIKQAIKQSSSWIAFFDSSSPQYKGVVESLSRAEEDAQCLGSDQSDGLRARLGQLADAADAACIFAVTECPGDPPPACVTWAAQLLTAGELQVGGAERLCERAVQQARYLARWRQLLDRALRYDLWRRRLCLLELERTGGDGLAHADHRILMRASARLRQAEEDLFDAPDAAALEQRGTIAKLDRVHDDLCLLSETHGAAIPACEPPARARPLLGQREAVDGAAEGATLTEAMAVADPVKVRPAQPVGVVDSLRLLGDVLVLCFSIAVGVLAALVILYFGKTFGSTEDYLTAFAAGATSQLLVSGLIATLGQMEASDRDAVTVTPATAATLDPGA